MHELLLGRSGCVCKDRLDVDGHKHSCIQQQLASESSGRMLSVETVFVGRPEGLVEAGNYTPSWG
jgi:hypothetical protein